VVNRIFTIRLVQWLSWVFKNKERKKRQRKPHNQGPAVTIKPSNTHKGTGTPYYPSHTPPSTWCRFTLQGGTNFSFWKFFVDFWGSDKISIFLEIGQGFRLQFGICGPSLTHFMLKTPKKNLKKLRSDNYLCPISKKSSGRRPISQIPGNSQESPQLPRNKWKTAGKNTWKLWSDSCGARRRRG